MSDDLKQLNKEDLYLLMESYRNMINMHSTLVNQQKRIIDLQNDIVKKQDDMFKTQVKSYTQLDNIVTKMRDCSINLSETKKTITTTCIDLDKSVTSNVGDIHEKLDDTKLEVTKQHSGINGRIYVAMGFMATIIIGLIGLAITLLDKVDQLDEITDMLQTIMGQIIGT